MPLRDYECKKCGHTLMDVYFTKESEVVLPEKCPMCKKVTIWKRLFPKIGLGRVKDGTPKFYPGK